MSGHCPVCKVPLHVVANRTGAAAVCSSCGGIWLDNACSRSVVMNLLEPAVRHTAQQADAMAAQKSQPQGSGYRAPAPRPAGDATPRLCPHCASPLAQSPFEPARIMLDVCASHGTWFDAGELWTMSQHFEMKSLMDDDDALAFGREMQAHRNAEMAGDFRAAGMLVGFLRR